MKKIKDFLYEDLSYKIRGCAFAVYNTLGFGHKESVYQKAFAEELKEVGIPFEREKVLGVVYKGRKVGIYRPDFVVDGKVIVEIKAVPAMFKGYELQLTYYLKSTNYKLGFLINFGGRKIDIRRRVWSPNYQRKSDRRKSAINQRKSVLAVLLAIVTLGLLVGGNLAQAAEPQRSGVQISPLSVERDVRPGDDFFFAISFFNPLAHAQQVRPKFKDFVTSASGDVHFLDYSSRRYTISRWADFAKEIIVLGPHEEQVVEVRVRVPEDAEVGGHFGAFFGEVRGNDEGEGPYRVTQNVAAGSLVFLSVLGEGLGDTAWEAELSGFSVEGRELGGLYFASDPLSFRTILSNTGIYHQNVWGGLTVRDMFDGVCGDFPLREKKALPDTYVAYSQPWKPNFPLGRYTATLEMLYGRNGEKSAKQEISFWVIDPRFFLVLGGLGAAIAFIAVRKRRERS